MKRKDVRKEVMITIYQMELNESYDFEKYKEKLKEKIGNKKEFKYGSKVLKEFLKDKDMVDDHIKANLDNWHITRLPKIDLAIMRLAITEFFYLEDIPIEVSVNEAIELAKEYSDKESSSFINGVLGSIINKGNLIDE
ncbi:MAG: transcription antitermination factor NusB [Bacillota bacterium]